MSALNSCQREGHCAGVVPSDDIYITRNVTAYTSFMADKASKQQDCVDNLVLRWPDDNATVEQLRELRHMRMQINQFRESCRWRVLRNQDAVSKCIRQPLSLKLASLLQVQTYLTRYTAGHPGVLDMFMVTLLCRMREQRDRCSKVRLSFPMDFSDRQRRRHRVWEES